MDKDCNCIVCQTARMARAEAERRRQEQEFQDFLALVEEGLGMVTDVVAIEIVLTEVTTEEQEDARRTQRLKGRFFTVVGSKNANGDQSHVGDVFEVIDVVGNLITARGIVSRDGKTNGWYNYMKTVTINTERFKTRPVSNAHVRALRGD